MKPDQKTYELELTIAKFLRYGVIACGVLIAIGWLLNIKWEGNPFYLYRDYDPIPFWQLVGHYTRTGNYGAIICFIGLAGLVSLPVWRVLLTGILFFKQKERAMACIAFFVFTLLIISFLLGMAFE